MGKGKKPKGQQLADEKLAEDSAGDAQAHQTGAPTTEQWRKLLPLLTEAQLAAIGQGPPAQSESTPAQAASSSDKHETSRVDMEREATRLFDTLKNDHLVRDLCTPETGNDATMTYRRDHALVMLTRELEMRASNDHVRCLLWARLLQMAPAFSNEAKAISLINLGVENDNRYRRLREALRVDQRCASVVNTTIVMLQAPEQRQGESITQYLARVRLEEQALMILVTLLPGHDVKAPLSFSRPGGAALFRGLSWTAQGAAERDRMRIFEAAASAADQRPAGEPKGEQLRTAAQMVMRQSYSAQNAFALLTFEDATLALERVNVLTGDAASSSARNGRAAVGAIGNAGESETAAVAAVAAGPGVRTGNGAAQFKCYNCGQSGHIARRCPEPRRRKNPQQHGTPKTNPPNAPAAPSAPPAVTPVTADVTAGKV